MDRPRQVDGEDRQAPFAPVCASGAEDAPLVECKIDDRLIQDAIEICDRRYPTKPPLAGKQYSAEFRASLALSPKTITVDLPNKRGQLFRAHCHAVRLKSCRRNMLLNLFGEVVWFAV
jgi:hypothetical protein